MFTLHFSQKSHLVSNICPEVKPSRSYFSPTFLYVGSKGTVISEHSQISNRPLSLFLRGENAIENFLLGDICKRGRRKSETSGKKARRLERENRHLIKNSNKRFVKPRIPISKTYHGPANVRFRATSKQDFRNQTFSFFSHEKPKTFSNHIQRFKKFLFRYNKTTDMVAIVR